MPDKLLELSNVHFHWPGMDKDLLVIPEFTMIKGEQVFLSGPSGSGKSSLLSLLAGIQVPRKGTIHIAGQVLSGMSGSARDRFRAEHIGFIFQQFNLLGYLNVIDNVTLACQFSSVRRARALERAPNLEQEALRLLMALGLNEQQFRASVASLSVGQQQRVAVARALIGAPELIIADEPSSALDADARAAFIELLASECKHHQITLLFVSHDGSLADRFDRSVNLLELNKAPTGYASGELV